MDINMFNSDKEMAKRTLKQYCSSWNEFRYDEIHNKPYFIGKRSKNSESEVLCPINSNKILTFNQLKSSIVDSGSSSVNLAIYSSDSTVVLHKAHMGLKSPIPVQEEKETITVDSDIGGTSQKRKADSDKDNSIIPLSDEQNVVESTTNSTNNKKRKLSSQESDWHITDIATSDDSNEGAK